MFDSGDNMPKKRGLGRDVTKSIEVMEELMDCLKKFHGLPIKRGLQSSGVMDEKFGKVVNDTKEKAFAASIAIEDLLEQVKGAKPASNKRFACGRVVSKFLEIS
jgi:hypothetical protein